MFGQQQEFLPGQEQALTVQLQIIQQIGIQLLAGEITQEFILQ